MKSRWLMLMSCAFIAVLVGGLVQPLTDVQAQGGCPDGTPGEDTLVCDSVNSGDWQGLGSDDQMTNNSMVRGEIDGGGGADVIVNNGLAGSIDGGSGQDTITNSESAVTRVIDGAGGGDTIVNDGRAGVILGSGGQDTITNNGTALLVGGGARSDTITNNGEAAIVFGGNGADTVTNTGEALIVAGGDGRDTVVNDGQALFVGGGARSDTITNNGEAAIVFGGNGADTVTNTGEALIVAGGNGADVVVHSGTAVHVAGGAGNDTVILQDGAVVHEMVDGGDDVDRLVFDQTVGAEGYAELAAHLAAANPGGGTIVISGQQYTWRNFEELVSLLKLARINDLRLNYLDFAATVVVYPLPEGGVELYTPTGEFAFRVERAPLEAALANGVEVMVDSRLGISLWVMADGNLMAVGPDGYTFVFDPVLCGVTA